MGIGGIFRPYKCRSLCFQRQENKEQTPHHLSQTVPDGLPNNAQVHVWTLDKGALKIPMYGKNYETKEFETYGVEFALCVSAKADDYENNLSETYPCDCDAYVIETDKNGLNVRDKGNKNAAIVGKIPFDADGTMVHLKRSATNRSVPIQSAMQPIWTIVWS